MGRNRIKEIRWWVAALIISAAVEYLLAAVYFHDLLFYRGK